MLRVLCEYISTVPWCIKCGEHMLLRPINPTLDLCWYGYSVFCYQFRMPMFEIVVSNNSSQDVLKFFREKQRSPLAESIPGPYHQQTSLSPVWSSTTPPSSLIANTAGHYITNHFSTNVPIWRWYQMPRPLLLMNVIDQLRKIMVPKTWFCLTQIKYSMIMSKLLNDFNL